MTAFRMSTGIHYLAFAWIELQSEDRCNGDNLIKIANRLHYWQEEQCHQLRQGQ
jgi:hypothetical protein